MQIFHKKNNFSHKKRYKINVSHHFLAQKFAKLINFCYLCSQ